MKHRSQNSDLLLPEFMERQIKESVQYYAGRRGLPLHRLTVFVSHRCNMFCHYCQGPHLTVLEGDTDAKKTMLREDVQADKFGAYLDEILQASDFIRHVHFTGGEATVNKQLPALIAATKARGLLSSITSNGLAGPDFYERLVESGLSEVRISFDSADPATFEKSVGVVGAFDKVVESIHKITGLRDEGKHDVFLVINACVGESSLKHMEETMSFMLTLEPNDLKFLLIVQDKSVVTQHESNGLTTELHRLLDPYPKERYYLLRRKIDSLFDANSSGLEEAQAQTHVKRCFIPMTERTLDGQNYYPCSIYLRHYGEPIGSLNESFERQQEKTLSFVESHNCREDPICLKYCVNCCKIYNIIMNIAVEADQKVIDTGLQLTVPEIDEVLAETLSKRAQRFFTAPPHSWESQLQRLFLIIKPYGMEHKQEWLGLLAEEGLDVEYSLPIEPWAEFATLLYSTDCSVESMRQGLKKSAVFSELEQGSGELLLFRVDPSPDVLLKLKYKMRVQVPSKRYSLVENGQMRSIHMTVCHSPDEVNIRRENTLIYHSFPTLRAWPRPLLRAEPTLDLTLNV
jgi:molybdenum cofactor biosynthesis enzyme MoaA